MSVEKLPTREVNLKKKTGTQKERIGFQSHHFSGASCYTSGVYISFIYIEVMYIHVSCYLELICSVAVSFQPFLG